jgi:hypothetical protein
MVAARGPLRLQAGGGAGGGEGHVAVILALFIVVIAISTTFNAVTVALRNCSRNGSPT